MIRIHLRLHCATRLPGRFKFINVVTKRTPYVPTRGGVTRRPIDTKHNHHFSGIGRCDIKAMPNLEFSAP